MRYLPLLSKFSKGSVSGHIGTGGTVESLPDEAAVRARLALEQLLEPLRRLIGSHFVGRTHELGRLTDYVDLLGPRKVLGSNLLGFGVRSLRRVRRTLIKNPPLFVHGPGGVGKSSLLARFILDHIDAPQGADMAFVMLDFDRAQVESRMPLSLLVAALHQLRAQFPQHAYEMLRMAEHLGQVMRGSDDEALERADSLQETLVLDFAKQVGTMLGDGEDSQRLLWVLDTFEEPQRLGESTVGALWDLMNTLQQALPQLRLVVCGRVVPSGFNWDLIPLDEFDEASARVFLRQRLDAIGAADRADDQTLAQAIKVVGRTPLALRLAARLLAEEDRQLLTLKLKRERVQAILFHRVLDHIRVDWRLESTLGDFNVDDKEGRLLQDELGRLVYPGLAVRRITPGVIEHVLARPCGVKLRDANHVARLFSALAQQVDIVEPGSPTGAEPSLLHRTDVRRMMLSDLEHRAGERLIRRIDRLAVMYHAGAGSLPNRAEEIYHRLRLQPSVATIRRRWLPGIEPFLTSALDEISDSVTRVMLAEMLGVTLNRADLENAEYGAWERQAIRRATDYLRSGNPELALKVLRERDEAAASGRLLRLKARALQQLGAFEEAANLAARSLDEAQGAGDFLAAAEAALLVAVADEAMTDLDGAAKAVALARDWGAELKDGRLLLRVQASIMRLARKRGAPAGEMEVHAQAVSDLLDRETLRDLRSRPTVLRELLAEMGARDLRLLRLGLDVLGIDLPSQEEATELALALDSLSDRGLEDLALAHGVVSKDSREVVSASRWARWLWSASPKEAGALMAGVVALAPQSEALLQQLARQFQIDVDRRIRRGTRARAV
jgi:tetratricopeptide (TPR) repeat protein